MSLEISDITKQFGRFPALNGVSLFAEEGEFLALLGPSGSGKTTLLRIIAGLELPDGGAVRYRDTDLLSKPVRERGIGFVFQHYALFRHMTAYENIAFGLRVRKWSNAKVHERVTELLHLIRLEELGQRFPNQLSGGQRQRVALARALAPKPHVLLLDEPFGALDAQVRQELRDALRRLHDDLHVTSIFVTHDHEEAFEVADRVVIMNHGRIEQSGTAGQVWRSPASPFVQEFVRERSRHAPRDDGAVPGTPAIE